MGSATPELGRRRQPESLHRPEPRKLRERGGSQLGQANETARRDEEAFREEVHRLGGEPRPEDHRDELTVAQGTEPAGKGALARSIAAEPVRARLERGAYAIHASRFSTARAIRFLLETCGEEGLLAVSR